MQYRNIKIWIIFLVSSIYLPCSSSAQIVVNGANALPYNPTNIIENVFLGSGVKINNIQYDGALGAVGVFENASPYIGINRGIVLSTGFVRTIEELNDATTNAKGSTSNQTYSDDDLQELAGANSDVLDIARYEITFTPESDTIRFRYVFASEEYPEFVCSNFNDVFGFFISGPNPAGGDYDAFNMARVPDPNDPSGTTFLNNNVAINSVNSGDLGTLGSIDINNCAGENGSLNFSQYYNIVPPNQFPVFDAYLDAFIAQAAVVPCQEYVIKLAIADVKDQDFDSAVFLEAGSLFSSALNVNLITESTDGSIAEGCAPAQINIETPFASNTFTNVQISSFPEGTFPDQASLGSDYSALPVNINIPPGSTSVSFNIEALEDNEEEGDEYIYLDVQRTTCINDTIKIKIRDSQLPQVMLPQDTSLCGNDILILIPEYDPPIVEFEDKIFTKSNDLILEESGGVYTSFIIVQGVEPAELGGGVLSKICIDTLVSRNLTDIEVHVQSPQGQILELTTNNGLRDKPNSCDSNPNSDECIDAYYNTCFTVAASQNINNGNPLQGSVFDQNENYTGDFLPEGNWNRILSNDASANGNWELIIKTDSVTTADISNMNSFLGSWSIHFESPYQVDHLWSPNFNIFCTECDTTFVNPTSDVTYKLNVTDSYGCTSFDEIRIEVLPVAELPQITDCVALSPSSIQITWNEASTPVEFYNVSQNSVPPDFQTTETNYVFEGLEANAEHTFFVSGFNGICSTNMDSITCSTPPCFDGPNITVEIIFAPSCSGRNDGGIEVSAIAENGGEVIYYLNGQVNNDGDFGQLTDGDYLVRVVDSDGCSTVQTVTVPDADDIAIFQNETPISCVGEQDAIVEIDILETDNEPYSILWQNASTEFIQEDLAMGTYFFTVTDGSGCNFEKSIVISDPEPLQFLEINAQRPPCFGDEGSIELTMTGGTGGYDYIWEESTENSSSINYFPGSYSVTVTDENGCSITNEIQVEERLEINLLDETIQAACNDEFSQEIELNIEGGAIPFEVDWGSGITGVEVVDVPVGMYELTITDVNNCTKIETVELINFPDLEIEFDLREPECFNTLDGIISLSSTIYTDGTILQEQDRDIIWDDGITEEAIGLLKGDSTYHFVITDDFGCKHDDSIYLPSPPAILLGLDTISMIECFGDANGSFSISPSGGEGDLSIEWSDNIPDLQNNTATNLSSGIYSVTVTDEELCKVELDFVFEQPEELRFIEDITDVKCFEEETGSIMGEVIGGVEPYDVDWSNGSNLEDQLNLPSGNYELSVTDANGCTLENSYEVAQPENPLQIDPMPMETECFGEASGSIIISAEGGTMPYNFLVNGINFFDNTMITGLDAGSYDLLVIDGAGCELNFEEIIVEESDSVYITLPSDTSVIFGSSLELEFMTNATNLVEYFWDPSSPEVSLDCFDCPNPIIEAVISDFFITLTVRDGNNCKYTTNQYFINENDDSFVEVPTGFSPNSDNRNDRLFIFGKEGVKVMNFEIFDRWGELLHSVEDITISDSNQFPVWDGNFNGKEVDSGVYVWKARIEKLNGEIDFLEGNVTILR